MKLKKLTRSQIESVVAAEEAQSLEYSGEGSKLYENRRTLRKFYNQDKFGDELPGQSAFVSSDVADVVNGTMPNLMRMFTQSGELGKFESSLPEYDQEAEHKTRYANWVFFENNDGVRVLHDMFHDGILQYTGVVKVYQDDSIDSETERYKGLSEQEFQALKIDERFEIKEFSQNDENGTYEASGVRINSKGRQRVITIPADEFVISKRATDFETPPLIGQYTSKTRSQLVQMGFDAKLVYSISADNLSKKDNEEDDQLDTTASNPTTDRSKDVLWLGEYYTYIDIDGDGISELCQVFMCNGKLLEYEEVDSHPYAVFIPLPIPGQAIGTCPADQVADLQYLKSHLIRQANNNIYATNFNRYVANDRVNLDDLLTQRHGGVVRIDGDGPIGDSVYPLTTTSQVPAVMEMIGYTDTQIERRSGITAHNQGIDTNSLNKTATGFQGIRDMSQMRIEMMATLSAAGAVKKIFNKIIELASKYQDENVQLRVNGAPMEIDPRSWRYKTSCKVNVGSGAGDHQAKIANLNAILNAQLMFLEKGIPICDHKNVYNIMKSLVIESGLKSAKPYFADPELPAEMVAVENIQLKQQLAQMQAQMQNPLAEAEQRKGEFRLAELQQKQEHDMNMKMAEMEQKDKYHTDEMALKLSDLEMKAKQNVQGSLI